MEKIIHIPGLSKELEKHINVALTKRFADIDAAAEVVKPVVTQNLTDIVEIAKKL